MALSASLLRRVARQHRLSQLGLVSSPNLAQRTASAACSSQATIGSVLAGFPTFSWLQQQQQQQQRRTFAAKSGGETPMTKRRSRVHDTLHHIDQIDKKFNLGMDEPEKPSKSAEQVMQDMDRAYQEWKAKAQNERASNPFVQLLNSSWKEHRLRILLVMAVSMSMGSSLAAYLQRREFEDQLADRDRTITRLELQLNAMAAVSAGDAVSGSVDSVDYLNSPVDVASAAQ